ncbi:MAG: STAS domain-containing protein [Nitriliruptorales bacterium]
MRCERIGPVRWSLKAGVVTVTVDGPLGSDDTPSVCVELHAALSGSDVCSVTCRGKGLAEPDLATVDLLARLRLAAGRLGRPMRVEDPSPRLQELLVLIRLEEILLPSDSGVESRGQAEQREEPLGGEEGVQPDDPVR